YLFFSPLPDMLTIRSLTASRMHQRSLYQQHPHHAVALFGYVTVSFCIPALSDPWRQPKIARQFLSIGKSTNLSNPAADRYRTYRTHPLDGHQPLGLRILKSNLYQFLVQSPNLPIDKFQQLQIFLHYPWPIAAEILSSAYDGPCPLKLRLGIDISLGVNRSQFIDHRCTLAHQAPPVAQKLSNVTLSGGRNPHSGKQIGLK